MIDNIKFIRVRYIHPLAGITCETDNCRYMADVKNHILILLKLNDNHILAQKQCTTLDVSMHYTKDSDGGTMQ